MQPFSPFAPNDVPPLPQEEISRLRRKLEKQRKVEVYADADEILQEEIKEYKVSGGGGGGCFCPWRGLTYGR